MAFRGIGTVLSVGVVPVAVAELTSITGLELSAETIDSTTLDSSGGYRTHVAGFKDAGEVSMEGYLNAAVGKGQSELKTLFDSGAEDEFKIVFPVASKTTWAFDGIVTGFSTSVDLEGLITFSATIKVTGEPTLTVTA